MSRKKINKSAAKRKPRAAALSPAQKLENEFLGTPLKLAAQFSKEIAALKQAENKLKLAISKLKAQAQKSSSRAKSTAIAKSLNSANKQFEETKKLLAATSNKLAKMSALRKLMSQFEKDWTKKSRSVKAKAKSNSKTKSKKSVAKKTKAPIIQLQQPTAESFESSFEDNNVSSAEATS